MIVQLRAEGLRLFRQHDHALVAGEFALAWRNADTDPPVSQILVMATALHDLSWRRADRAPVLNGNTGRPFDFQDYSTRKKFRAVAEALERIRELDAYAALLVSLHYASFAGAPAWFVDEEWRRRDELADEIGAALPTEADIETDLGLLRLFDALSLYLCLTPPGALPEGRPRWLGDAFTVPEWDDPLTVRWLDGDTLALDPWPFGSDPVDVEVPHRDLGRTHFHGKDDLAACWRNAEDRIWRVAVVEV